jgi:hypothetical protein
MKSLGQRSGNGSLGAQRNHAGNEVLLLTRRTKQNKYLAQSQENSMAEKRNSSVEMKNGNSNVLWAAATERDQMQIQHRHAKRE